MKRLLFLLTLTACGDNVAQPAPDAGLAIDAPADALDQCAQICGQRSLDLASYHLCMTRCESNDAGVP